MLSDVAVDGTPNPRSRKFTHVDGLEVVGWSAPTLDVGRGELGSPAGGIEGLAEELLAIEAVERVFFGPDYVTVSVADEGAWGAVEPHVRGSLDAAFKDPAEAFARRGAGGDAPAEGSEEPDETVEFILEVLEARVRPYAQGDGGDVIFDSFEKDTGTLWLKMVGACASCPSSTITMRYNIQNVMRHYVPEVKDVRRRDIDDGDGSYHNDPDWTG